ncbi:MAG: lipid kinase [Bauldia sp.]|nr:lipid kinase [Bauldia sp.]
MAGGRLLLVVNPHASRAAHALGAAVSALFAEGFALDIRQCAGPDEVHDLILRESAGVDAIVIGGGDGTVSGTLPALIEVGLPVGILPLGTANDLARTLGIPVNPSEAARIIAAGSRRKIDIGLVNDIHFLNVSSIGLAVEVTDRLDPELKRTLGPLSYAAAAIQTLGDAERFQAVIACNGERTDVTTYQVTVGNGVRYGGGARVSTEAAIDDGILDIFAIETASIPELVAMAPAFFEGRHGGRDDVKVFRCTEATIETIEPMPISTDGEITTETPARYSVMRQALEVFAPR